MTTSPHCHKRTTAASLLTHTRNPILLAHALLLHGNGDLSGHPSSSPNDPDPSGPLGGAQGHCHLSGPVAEELGRKWGVEMVEKSYFWTRRRWEQHRRGLQQHLATDTLNGIGGKDVRDEQGYWGDEPGWDGLEYLPQGTVGCVVLDAEGTICVATSTGGLTNKLSGRIGDTPTVGAGFWAESWVERVSRGEEMMAKSPLERIVLGWDEWKGVLVDCLPGLTPGYQGVSDNDASEQEKTSLRRRAVAMSGSGNGDAFLRIAAARTTAAIARYSPHTSLASAFNQVAGPGGKLQNSAGDRWGKTGEGEGGIIGIGLVDGVGEVVYDFNCGGMFRTWVEKGGRERVMVFREEYDSKA
ncbi:MAG: hypothetical protein Q9183_003016 [Haloplaca sp. 2 TL-2023]